MESKKIRVVAKIETDARNYFFVKMLYGIADSARVLETVYQIEDTRLFDTLIGISNEALKFLGIRNKVGNAIVIYYTKDALKSNRMYWYSNSGPDVDYTNPMKVIAGTVATNDWKEINYLISRISKTMEENNMGEFYVQYGNKLMSEEEFYEFQRKLSVYEV